MPESATTEAPANLAVFYGGTFDPVHRGHLQVARHARDLLGTVIRLMPAADPPHRAAPGASAQQRAEMLDLAVLGERGLQVDRRELARATPSYSIETLQGIRAELGPAAPVALLIGADGLQGLSSWKDWRGLFDLAHFVVAERPGIDLARGLPEPLSVFLQDRWTAYPRDLGDAPAGRVWRLQQPLYPQSATDVRARIASGKPWRELVPAPVADYIDRHQLYTGGVAASASL